MSSVLFLSHPAIGHINALLAIALRMRDDGHQVRFLIPNGREGYHFGVQIFKTTQSALSSIKSSGLHVDRITPYLGALFAVLRLPKKKGYEEVESSMDCLSRGIEYYAGKVVRYCKRFSPDILVTDYTFFASHIAADLLGLPYAVVYQTGLPFRGPQVPPFGSGLPIGGTCHELKEEYRLREQALARCLTGRVASARKKFGLPMTSSDTLTAPYSPWLNLITSTGAIEAERDNLGMHTFFIGPCISKKNGQGSAFPFYRLRPDRYKIYISLGTVFNNKPEILGTIMSALSDPGYQLIVSAGGAYSKLVQRTWPGNIMIFPNVPQTDLLPGVDLAIVHGGNNTTNETLAAGKPLIVVPIGGEQADNASRVEYLRAGLRIAPEDLGHGSVIQAVKRIRGDRTFCNNALVCKKAINRTDGPGSASRCIGWVAENKKPLQRGENPVTITRELAENLIVSQKH